MEVDDPRSDFPLGTRHPELVRTPTGRRLDEITLEALRAGTLSPSDMRATPETLRRQGAIARASGRDQLGASLDRAAELAPVPDEMILAVYAALRPGRSSTAELDAWAVRLETEYGAVAVAALVREARDAYLARGLLKAKSG
jgi:propanediol dehydratase small subunit